MMEFIGPSYNLLTTFHKSLSWTGHSRLLTCSGLEWLIIMGSGFNDWIYWHFFTITINYNSSHIELLLNSLMDELWLLSNECSLKNLWLTAWNRSRSQSHIATDGQSVSKSWCPPSDAHDQIFIAVWQLRSLLWGSLSDERTGLSFVYAAGFCQHSLSRVQVPCFTVSDLRLPFSSPPTTRRVTMEVFDPAFTRVGTCSNLSCMECRSRSHIATDGQSVNVEFEVTLRLTVGQSVSKSWCRAPSRAPFYKCHAARI
jgi:hypothetical protein